MAAVVCLRREKQTLGTDEFHVLEVVDGQQRLTTLIILLNALKLALKPKDKAEAKLARELSELLVKVEGDELLLLQTNHDSSHYFATFLRKGTSPASASATTLADREILRAIEDCQAFTAKQQRIKTGLMQDLLTRGIDEHGNLRSEQFHEFKDSPLGRIPVEWEVRSLRQCVRADAPICYGILMPGQSVDNGVPVIKVKDIVGGRIVQDNLLLTDRRIDRQYRRSRLRSGDLVITIRGTTGRLAVVPPELDGANITQDTARVRLSDYHSARFCFYCLQSESAQGQIALHTIGQAVKGINIGDVKRLLLGMPSLHEQERLANRFEGLEKTTYATSRALAKLKSTKAGLMQDLLTGNRRVTALLEQSEEVTT